jgi:hypothetical protein
MPDSDPAEAERDELRRFVATAHLDDGAERAVWSAYNEYGLTAAEVLVVYLIETKEASDGADD